MIKYSKRRGKEIHNIVECLPQGPHWLSQLLHPMRNKKKNDVISSSDPFDKLAECSFSTSGKSYHLGDWSTGKDLTLMMASALVVETSLANNSPFQDFTHPHDHFQLRYVTL